MHNARFRSTAKPGHRQCIAHNVGRHAWLQRPVDHFPVEQVQKDGKVPPAFVGPQVRDVRGPALIRRVVREVSVQQIRCRWQAVRSGSANLNGGISGNFEYKPKNVDYPM